jgi:hypothetical protein
MTSKRRVQRVSERFTRLLRRDANGSLYDLEEHRLVSVEDCATTCGPATASEYTDTTQASTVPTRS